MTDSETMVHRSPPRTLPEALVRTLRHEVSDFLQKVYASVAILKGRLPAEAEIEQGVLARLRARAEVCRQVLDAAHDYVCPLTLDLELLDLAALAERLVSAAQTRYANVKICTENEGSALTLASARRASWLGEALLDNACAAARSKVCFRTEVDTNREAIVWSIRDDGPGVSEEVAAQLFTPFFTMQAGHAGLGLALAQKLMTLHGGRLTAGNLSTGGFEARAVFPIRTEMTAAAQE
jgi:signal transduction histidine kinase